jgi:hypothetical protein
LGGARFKADRSSQRAPLTRARRSESLMARTALKPFSLLPVLTKTSAYRRNETNKPNLINISLDKDVYLIPKVMDSDYLGIGQKKLASVR